MVVKKFSPVKPLRERALQFGMCIASLKHKIKTDPDFPVDELVAIGGSLDQPRLGLTDRGAEKYQKILARRAAQPRRVPSNLRDPRAAAFRSVEVRRAKAAARRAREESAL